MGPGDQDLGTAGGAADVHHIHLDVHPLGELLAGDLLARHQQSLGGLGAGADAKGYVAVPGINAGDHAGQDLVLLGVELVVHLAALGFPQALNDDLLAVAGGDTAELRVVHGNIHDVADLILGGDGLGLGQRHLIGGVHIVLFVHHVLLDVHLQGLVLLVHIHDDVLHAVVIPLVGGGDGLDDLIHHKGLGNVALFLQQSQSREDLRRVHANGFLLLFASHVDSPYSFFNTSFLTVWRLVKIPPAGGPEPRPSWRRSAPACLR